MDKTISAYFAAWNETDAAKREQLLRNSIAEDTEIIDPTGRATGVSGFGDRIGRFQQSAPGAKVLPASGVDSHNEFERYAWKITQPDGATIVDGIDVVDVAPDGRLQRVVMFFGPLPPAES